MRTNKKGLTSKDTLHGLWRKEWDGEEEDCVLKTKKRSKHLRQGREGLGWWRAGGGKGRILGGVKRVNQVGQVLLSKIENFLFEG